MTLESELNMLISELKEIVLYGDPSLYYYTSINQISAFIDVFESALANVRNGSVPHKPERNLGVARVISEQWPYDSELGCKIISAESRYKNH